MRNICRRDLLLPLDGNSLQTERFAAQLGAKLPLKKQLWQQTVAAKILNQAPSVNLMQGA
jgi:CRISPR-associated protein Cas1